MIALRSKYSHSRYSLLDRPAEAVAAVAAAQHVSSAGGRVLEGVCGAGSAWRQRRFEPHAPHSQHMVTISPPSPTVLDGSAAPPSSTSEQTLPHVTSAPVKRATPTAASGRDSCGKGVAACAVRSQAAHQSATGMIDMPVGVPACGSEHIPSTVSPATSAFGQPFQPLPTAGSAIVSRARRDAAALCESSGGSQPRSRACHSLRRQAGWPGAMSSSRSTSNSRSATAPHTG